ncbi:MAG: DegT/DnrJ/EryC1/StrS family aminotransferase [Phycisphaerales bacterium]|nr:DegT/DnrJ/EryC1/StrS family aminotransferase [Phycisphaerales bacterium]
MSRSTAAPKAPVIVPVHSGARLAVRGGAPVSANPVPFMSTALSEADIAAATAVLKSGMLRQAARCAELEKRFGEMSGARHMLTCANGTVALQLAYEALVEPGDEVLVPAWSFIATVAMVVARGATPVFCDALPDTMQVDPADLERRITPRTTAISVTHLYGCPVDIDAVQMIAAKHKLRVIYDAAQAHLSTYRGRGIGEFGDAVTYSLYATKNLATGEGGLLSTNDPGLARTFGLLRSHGETDKYLHERVGYNYRLNDIAAAIGCSRLDRLPEQTAARREAASRYNSMVAAVDGLEGPATTPGAEPVYHLYTVKLDPARFTCTRDEFCAALKAEGVPTAVHYPRPLTRQPALAKFAREPLPVVESLCRRVFCLPMHHDLGAEHFRVVGEALAKVAAAYRA